MMFASLNRLNRKGSTASWLSGPPRLNRTTAMRLLRWIGPRSIAYPRQSLTIFTRSATCSGGSPAMPWPRLKMNGP